MGLQAKTTSPEPRKPKMDPTVQRHPREEKNKGRGRRRMEGLAETDCWKDFGIAVFLGGGGESNGDTKA